MSPAAPISLQHGDDDSHRVGGSFSVEPIVHVHQDASREDVIALAASRVESLRALLELLTFHSIDDVARAAHLLLGPVGEIESLLNAGSDSRRWKA